MCSVPGCNGTVREDVMMEDGIAWPIWVCDLDPFHWGDRW